MPLEIGLLEINTQVDQQNDGNTENLTEMKDEIVIDCIEKVLQILKDREEL